MASDYAKFAKLFEAMDDESLTRDEFVQAFEKVVQYVMKINEKQDKAIADLEKTYHMLLNKSQSDHTNSLNEIKGQVNDVFVGDQIQRMRTEHEAMMSAINTKLESIRHGKDGERGMPGPKGSDGSPDNGEQIIDKVNKDKSKKKIKKEKVEGLSDIETFAKTADANSRLGLRIAGDTVRTYDYSSQLNGVLKTFTLPANAHILLLISSSFPTIFRPTTDYTYTASTFTFTSEVTAASTLATGQTLILLYKVQ